MTKLVGSTSLIESALDNALSAHTVLFDQDRYSSVYSAYIMLNKVEVCEASQFPDQFYISIMQGVLRVFVRSFTKL